MTPLLRTLLLASFLLAFARPAAAGEPRSDMKVQAAATETDTLAVSWRQVYRVAMIELEKNEWTIQRVDSVNGRFITHWKKFDHPLARLAFGELYARCVVDVKPLSDTTTELSFRGGLAGPPDLDRNPMFPTALTAYKKAAGRWVARVRTSLAATAMADPAAPPPTVR